MLWENTPGTQELEAESEMEQPVRWNPAPRPEHPQGDLKGDRRKDTCERADQTRPGSQHTPTYSMLRAVVV